MSENNEYKYWSFWHNDDGKPTFPEGYTNVSESLAQNKKYGVLASLVFGAVFRLANQKGHTYASTRAIAERLGMSRTTVIKYLKLLEGKNKKDEFDDNLIRFIVDVTPEEFKSVMQVRWYAPLMENYCEYHLAWKEANKKEKEDPQETLEAIKKKIDASYQTEDRIKNNLLLAQKETIERSELNKARTKLRKGGTDLYQGGTIIDNDPEKIEQVMDQVCPPPCTPNAHKDQIEYQIEYPIKEQIEEPIEYPREEPKEQRSEDTAQAPEHLLDSDSSVPDEQQEILDEIPPSLRMTKSFGAKETPKQIAAKELEQKKERDAVMLKMKIEKLEKTGYEFIDDELKPETLLQFDFLEHYGFNEFTSNNAKDTFVRLEAEKEEDEIVEILDYVYSHESNISLAIREIEEKLNEW